MAAPVNNASQSVQRLTEWRNSIGSNGLAVVGDFLDNADGLDTTEARQNAATELLDNNRYIYLKTRDICQWDNDEITVSKTSDIVPCTHAVLETIQVKRHGRYRGPLVVQTAAQCWLDFEGLIDVPGYVDRRDSPLAALVLSATAVGIVIHAVFDVLTAFRYIALSGSGPMDILQRRAMMLRSRPGAAASSR